MQSTMDADDGGTGIRLARDQHSASSFLEMPSSADSRVVSKRAPSSASAIKRKDTSDNNHRPTSATAPPPPRISIVPNSRAHQNAQVQKLNKRTRLHLQQEPHLQPEQGLSLHQSTCLNLNTGTTHTDESELWILPNFDEWESDSPAATPRQISGEWAPLVSRAVNSNRERLRRRLEGDGWDFVYGRYGEDGKMLKELADAGEESVDEEFDVVVLPTMLQVSC